MKKTLRYALKKYYHYKIKKSININKSTLVSKYTEVHLSEGSSKKDIYIGDNVMLHCKLYSESGGKIYIGDNSNIRKNTSIWSVNEVFIGANVIISDGIVICDNNNHPIEPCERLKMISSGWSTKSWKWSNSLSSKIRIEDNVWIGKDAKILKGVTIGEGSIVGMGSVVTKNVPRYCIVAGNPAKVVKELSNNAQV